MSPETERAYSEIELYPIERLLTRLESGSKEVLPGKFVRISIFGTMSHIPSPKPHPPKKHVHITISEACNQLQTEVSALITIDLAPKVVSITKRIGRTALIVHDEQKAMLNWDMIREIERDLKAYIKLKGQDEAPAVQRIKARAHDAAVQIEAAETHFEARDQRNGSSRKKGRKDS